MQIPSSSPSTDVRPLVWQMVQAICRKRQLLDDALEQLHSSPLDARDRGFARQLLMVVLRRHGQINAVLQTKLQTPLVEGLLPVHDLLMLGVAQLVWLDTPPHAAIDTAVQLCKQAGFVHQAGLVNAVLRRVSEEKESLLAATDPNYNLPSWLKGSWRKAYGRDVVDAIAAIHTTEPMLDITVKGDPQEWATKLGGDILWGQTIRRITTNVTQLEGYAEGEWWVQDVAATLPVRLLGDVTGKQVVDLCAAPGGKTAQLAAAGAQVVAVDRSHRRMQRLEENMQRLGFVVESVVADGLEASPEIPPDAVVIDAPCTATGTVRRHPDLLINRHEKELAEMVGLQQELLHRVIGWMKPASLLVYSVCSLQPEEGEQQIANLLANCPDVTLCPVDATSHAMPPEWVNAQGMVRTLPHFWAEKGGMDGFFAAVLRKND